MHFLSTVQFYPAIAAQPKSLALPEDYRSFSHAAWIIGIATLVSLSVALWNLRKKTGSRNLNRKPKRINEQSRNKSVQAITCLPVDKMVVISETVKSISKPFDLRHHCDRLAQTALEYGEPQTREFMNGIVSRLRKDAPQTATDMPISLIEELVDRVDELKLLCNKETDENAAGITAFLEGIVTLLDAANVQLLQSETWSPEIQRALSKTPTHGIFKPTITSFVSSGFCKSSKLIRKQEVLLAIPLQP